MVEAEGTPVCESAATAHCPCPRAFLALFAHCLHLSYFESCPSGLDPLVYSVPQPRVMLPAVSKRLIRHFFAQIQKLHCKPVTNVSGKGSMDFCVCVFFSPF